MTEHQGEGRAGLRDGDAEVTYSPNEAKFLMVTC